MERTLLQQILESAPGIEKTAQGYEIGDEQRASVYLGRSGQAAILTDLVRIALHEAHMEAESKDHTLHFVLYEPIVGLALRRPRQESPRTGF